MIKLATVNAAAAIKRPDLGTLKVGSVGEATVIDAGERQVRLCRFDRRAHDGRQAAALGRRGAGGPLVASGVMDDPPDQPKESSSPACLAHEADDAYMGFATKAEIAAFLKALAEAENAGRPHAGMLREMLPRCGTMRLHRELSAKLEAQESIESET